MPPRFLTPADVAEILNVSVSQVMALLRSRELRGVKFGGKGEWRVEGSELEAYIAAAYAATDDAYGAPGSPPPSSTHPGDPGSPSPSGPSEPPEPSETDTDAEAADEAAADN